MSKQTFEKIDEVTEVCKLTETEGFDPGAGTTWIYPTNYTCRDYQYSIIQEALLKNTMVSLPTGLGKTFIAAVVMYNFYRWYPQGKIIFMAPTRPLVKQQVDACYNVMAIPKEVTAELTGSKLQESRKSIWNEKRVFFITPQILQNDLTVASELGLKIKCLVIDEAHKAKGNHAYCEVIRKLKSCNKYFRVLALSATPGNSVNDVLEVINNLLIAHLEIRTDESPDVLPYVFERSLETVVVELDDMLQKVRDDYIKVLEKYTRILMHHNVLTGNYSNLTKGKIFMTMKSYQERNQQNRDRNFSDIMKNLTICHTLYYAYELLLRHGLRSFLLFFQDHIKKPLLCQNALLQSIIQEVGEYMGPLINIETLPDGSITGIPASVKFGHPKFYKLRDITCDHFKQHSDNESRIIIFCEYRETVMEAFGILSLSQPLVKPRIFMGRTSITQKQQISVIKAFRDGHCNTLISTCIGEEGLDVGNVDLIICFDINNKSPIRMIQRMGRTGRKRAGRVVILVTEGREQQTLKECLIQKQNVNNHIMHSKALQNDMYKENPRMVPLNIAPKCDKIFITVKQDNNRKLPQSKSKNLKDMFKRMSAENKNIFANNDEFSLIETTDKLPIKETYWNKGKEILNSGKIEDRISYANKIDKIRILQPTSVIGHSVNSKVCVSLLQKCESKKFNLPITQMPILISQQNQLHKPSANTPDDHNLKQTDIRHVFVKPESMQRNKIPMDADDVGNNYELKTVRNTDIPNYLPAPKADYNNNCKLCSNFFDCSQYYSTSVLDFNISLWIEPDASICDNFDSNNLLMFEKTLTATVQPKLTADKCDENTKTGNEKNDIGTSDITQNTDDSITGLINSPFKLPRTIDRVLTKCNLFDTCLPNVRLTQVENAYNANKNNTCSTNVLCSLNINDFNDAEFTQLQDIKVAKTATSTEHDLSSNLNFFNISTLEEIFDDASHQPINQIADATIIYTPPEKYEVIHEERTPSPILSSSNQSRRIKNFSLFDHSHSSDIKKNESSETDKSKSKPNLRKLLNHTDVQSKYCQNSYNANGTTDFEDIIDTSWASPVLSRKRKNWDNVLKNGVTLDVQTCSSKNASNEKQEKTEIQTYQKVNCTEAKENADVLMDFCDSSILDMFCEDPFEDLINEIKKNVHKESVATEIVETSNNHDNIINGKDLAIVNENKQWEDDIWNFCVDTDNSLHDSNKPAMKLSGSPGKSDFANVKSLNTLPTPEVVINLTSDSDDSACKSPVLMPSQRRRSQRTDARNLSTTQKEIAESSKTTKTIKLNNKGLLSLKKTANMLEANNSSKDSCAIEKDPKNSMEFDDEDYFHFTFNNKRVPEKNAADQVELQQELSPVLSKNCSVQCVQISDDDEFEFEQKKHTWIFPKLKPSKQMSTNNRPSGGSKRPNNKNNTKPKIDDCPYVYVEADVSISDSDVDVSADDGSFEKSFVDDNDLANTTIMHAEYLQSVRAADSNRGMFKIPEKVASNINVYSQVDNDNENNTYVNDSFCVNTEDMGCLCDDVNDMSELEIAELILKEKHKKRKVKKKTAADFQLKRRRIIESSSDDSD